jgi:hypothetical protein
MPEPLEVHDKVYDLSDNRDLTEIEKLCSRPDKYRLIVDETIVLPFRHIRHEVLKQVIPQ